MTALMKYSLGGLVGVLLLGGALAMGVATQDNGKLAPGIKVGGLDVGDLTSSEAALRLTEKTPVPQVKVTAGNQSWTVGADTLGWKVLAEQSLSEAETYSRERPVLERILAAVGRPETKEYPLLVKVDESVTKAALTKMTAGLATQPKSASVAFDSKALKYAVTAKDVPGKQADAATAAKTYAANPKQTTLNVPVITWRASATTEKLQALAEKGNKMMRPLTVTLQGSDRTWSLTPLQVANFYWVKPEGIVLDEKAIKAAFDNIAGYIEVPAHNARFAWRDGVFGKVGEKPGLMVKRQAAYEAFKKAIVDSTVRAVPFPAEKSQPKLKLADLPKLDGLELIASGYSTYYGSSPERRTNVANAATKIDGAVVAAGQDFSFLNSLGGITPANGFVGGLIISGGRTVDGLGGGVCQVSTTAFRALYNAGLPVVERNQHSYRVKYYEPQVGFEAAVYDPGVDLKMKNDTSGPIVVRAYNNNARSRLVVEVWGTKPKRSVYVSPAVILSRTPHPPAKYVVNPRLRPGGMVQVDWAQDGYNLYITRTIKDAKGTRTDRTSTFYKPWQAVYEVGPS